MTVSILVASIPCVSATNDETTAQVEDTVEYIDSERGVIELERVESQTQVASSATYQPTRVDCYIDSTFAYTIVANSSAGTLSHIYPDGSVDTWDLDEIVEITDHEDTFETNEDASLEEIEDSSTDGGSEVIPYSTDYVSSETFLLNSRGQQLNLAGTGTTSSWENMGYRGGYSYAPNVYGYLSRQTSGYVTEYSDTYKFDAGVTWEDAAIIIIDTIFFTTSGDFEPLLSDTVDILVNLYSTYQNQYTVTFSIRCYEWNYRVRLNSTSGTIIYTTYRTKSYEVGTNTSNSIQLRYMSSAYDEGFPLANTELIKTGIDSYLG